MASVVAAWPMVALGAVLTQYTEHIDAPEPRPYPKLSVKLYGKGVVLDVPADGALLKMQRHQLARAGQVILSEIWGKKGAIGIVPHDGEGALCTSHFFLFDVNHDRIDTRWLQAIFAANYLQDQLDSEARGTTGYAAVRPRNLLSANIPLPPLDEQRRIVARIVELAARIEEARGLRREAAAEAGALLRSSLAHAFERGDRFNTNESSGTGAELLQSQAFKYAAAEKLNYNGAHTGQPNVYQEGLYPIPATWIWTDLGSVLTYLVDCVNDTPDFSPTPTDFLGLKSTNIRPYRLDLNERWFVTEEDYGRWTRRETPRPGDVILTREAPMGNACMLPDGVCACLTQRLMLLRTDTDFVDGRYLLHYLNSTHFQRQILEQCRGLTTPHIRVKDAPYLKVPLPPRCIQDCIVAYLDDVQTKVAGLRRLHMETAAELDALLPSVLDKAFRGEL